MRTAFRNNPYKWLIITIVLLFLTGLFLPHTVIGGIYKDVKTEHLYYGWEWLSYRVHFVIATIILLISLSSRIALRLLVIRFLLILLIPIVLVMYLHDVAFMYGGPFPPGQRAAFFLNYSGIVLTFVYGVLHFRTSYRKYKALLRHYEKQSSDLLDV